MEAQVLPGTIAAIAALVSAIGAFLVARSNSRKIDQAKIKAALIEIERDRATAEARRKAEEDAARVAKNAAVAAAAAEAAKKAALEGKEQIVQIGDAVYELGKRVDGRLTQLLEAAEELGAQRARAALAEGIEKGASAERARTKLKRPPR